MEVLAARVEGLEKRMDRVEVRLDGIEARLRGVEVGLAQISAKLDGLAAQVAGFDKLTTAMLGKMPSWWQVPAVAAGTLALLGAALAPFRRFGLLNLPT